MKIELAGTTYRDIAFSCHVDLESVRITETPFGTTLDLDGGVPDGDPGGPGLPVMPIEVALPRGTHVADMHISIQESVPLGKQAFIAPLQPAAPGVRRCSHFERLREDGLAKAWPKPAFVPPDPHLYERAKARGESRVRLTRLDESGPQPIATLLIRPIGLNERGEPVLATRIDVVLHLRDGEGQVDTNAKGGEQEEGFSSRAQVARWTELTRSRVMNPDAVVDLEPIFRPSLLGAEYLIITDNVGWSPNPIQPSGPLAGDLVAEFERLAAWKRQKGLTARVVTVTDIVNGRYGTFNGSCRRDLQEVLREFVKWAHATWGTAWLLLGGDLTIVPARSVVGFVGGFTSGTVDPPPAGAAFWTGTFLKVQMSVSVDTPLIRSSDGRRIPYDAAGTSGPMQVGWYFTDASYTTRSSMPTPYVRVNGPAANINTELFWLTNDNTIPSDLYYADVAGYPSRSANGTWVETRIGRSSVTGLAHLCGGHDWDTVGNGLYGQWTWSGDLDGVRYVADVSVGRAPVASATEARTFVDKVLAYEQQGGLWTTGAWLRRLLMVSSNWGGRTGYWPASTLTDDRYTRASGADHAVIQLSTAPSSFNSHLLSHVTDTDERLLPFRMDAGPGRRGWYYAASATNLSPSSITVSLPWQPSFSIPVPSRWIVAFGANDELSPMYFVVDDAAGDGSMLDQEALRLQLSTDVPGWSQVHRLYEDDVDLPAAPGAPPLEHLSATGLEAQLDQGPHIVSLSGHGYWGGCCGLGPSMRTSLTNGTRTFIAYADSCLTNQFDVEDAISEQLVQNEHGGAVAYVGNTRFSWIGVGDDFQRNFFKGLPATRALGTLHDRRLAMVNAATGFYLVYNRWSIHALNLIGDPEMRVWTHAPWRLCLELPESVYVHGRLAVQVLHGNEPVPDAVVSLDQGAGVLRRGRSDRNGVAAFDLEGLSPGDLHVTAVHPEAATTRTTISVKGWRWLDVIVTAVRTSPEGTFVSIRDDSGDRTIAIAADAGDQLSLLAQASGAGRPVRVLLSDTGALGGVEMGGA